MGLARALSERCASHGDAFSSENRAGVQRLFRPSSVGLRASVELTGRGGRARACRGGREGPRPGLKKDLKASTASASPEVRGQFAAEADRTLYAPPGFPSTRICRRCTEVVIPINDPHVA